MTLDIPKEKWSGEVRQVTIGATADDGGSRTATLTVGGETTLPYLYFEGEMKNRPALALEIRDCKPDDWSPLLEQAWGDTMADPGAWAKAPRSKMDLRTLPKLPALQSAKYSTPRVYPWRWQARARPTWITNSWLLLPRRQKERTFSWVSAKKVTTARS